MPSRHKASVGRGPPVFTSAPASATIPGSGGTIQFTAVASSSVAYSLTVTRSGITIDPSGGLVTVAPAAANTSGSITVRATAWGMYTDATCAVTVQQAQVAAGFIPEAGYSVIPSGGSFVDGASITITGSGFGTKPNGAKPFYFFDFEAALGSHPTYSRNAYSGGFNAVASRDTAIKPNNSAASMKFDIGSVTGTAIATEMVPNSDNVFLCVKKLYDFSFSGAGEFNLKMYRAWANNYSNDISAQTQAADNVTVGDDEGNPRTDVSYGTIYWGGFGKAPQNTWVQEEIFFQESSALDAVDGIWHHFRNAVCARAFSARWLFRSTAHPIKFTLWFLDQKSNANGIGPAHVFYDYVYIDDSWCRVFISDEAAYNTATTGTPTTREIQIPLAWADGQIQFVLRFGERTSLVGKHLWVQKADGTAIRIGSFS